MADSRRFVRFAHAGRENTGHTRRHGRVREFVPLRGHRIEADGNNTCGIRSSTRDASQGA